MTRVLIVKDSIAGIFAKKFGYNTFLTVHYTPLNMAANKV